MSEVGVVIIGRNEGERLRHCLAVLAPLHLPQVYVDSGSTDGSVALAQTMGAQVVELEQGLPFTAARARNRGAETLLLAHPNLAYIQFLDGDCQLIDGWLPAALNYLQEHPQVAVVCGRRRERFRNQTLYNRLCDMEWNTPPGNATEFGGDALIRAHAYHQVGGYRNAQIAGEEPEMAARLAAAGWQIVRLDQDMTWHDAAMTRFRQWWKRTVRSGHALAELAWLHGRSPAQTALRARQSTLIWTLGVFLVLIGLWLIIGNWAWLTLLIYVPLTARIYRYRRSRGDTPSDCLLYSLFCVLGKWPQLWGLLRFHLNLTLGRQSRLIEYKNAEKNQPTFIPAKATLSANPSAAQTGNP